MGLSPKFFNPVLQALIKGLLKALNVNYRVAGLIVAWLIMS
jgi:hypothetical protein